MACPLFIPSTPLGELVSIPTPLGDLYCGHCAAEPSATIDPGILRRYCNFGYARGHCERAAQSDSDAVRFLVRGARGSIVEIAWSIERDHHPVAVGNMEIETAEIGIGPADTLTCQAKACAAAYLRQSHSHPGQMGRIPVAAHL